VNDYKPSPWVYLLALALLQALLAVDLIADLLKNSGHLGGATQLWSLTLAIILVAWVRADRRARQFSVPFEFDVFVLFFWPVAVPFYLCWTRRWKGLLITLGFLGVLIAPAIVAATVYVVSTAPR